MKILAVLGSPREGGSSDRMAEAFLGEADQLGAHIERVRLSRLKYKGCLGCGRCKADVTGCVQRDELTPVLEGVQECDALILSSPMYFLDVSSQTKGFIDRCYGFCEPHMLGQPSRSRLAKGKAVVLMISQGADEGQFADIIGRYQYILDMIGFSSIHILRGCRLGFKKDAVARRDDLLQEARETARKIMRGEIH